MSDQQSSVSLPRKKASLEPRLKGKSGSIRERLLVFTLAITVIAVLVITAIAIDTAGNISRVAQETGAQSLRQQAEIYLLQINESITKQNDLIFDRASRDVQTIAQSVALIYEEWGTGDIKSWWSAIEHLNVGPEGQYLNGPEDPSSVFVPNTQTLSPEAINDLERSAYLDLLFEPVFKNNPNTVAIYFGTPSETVRYYPNIMLGELVPPDFRVTQRVWYTGSVDNNVGKQTPGAIWSPVYLDATGLGLVTTVAIPVYNKQAELLGVVGLDITLGEISENIETARFLETGYSFLVDEKGKAIILPEQGYIDMLGRQPEPNEFGVDLLVESASNAPQFTAIAEKMALGEDGFASFNIGDRELFIAYKRLESTGWSLASVVAAEDVLQSIGTLQSELSQTTRSLVISRVIPISVIIAILLIVIAMIAINRVVNPLQKLAEAAKQISTGNWYTEVPVSGGDEVGLLADTIRNMVEQVRQSFQELEQRVSDRTKELERRSKQIQTAAQVSRDITIARNLDSLLSNAVNLINERFGFYNVGIFLVDQYGEYAHLRAASGERGARVLEKRLKLRVGQQGLVGQVTGHGQAKIAQNVHEDSGYFASPLLPETQSEIVLPLRAADKIIGALDVQSEKESAFSEEDVVTLQTLADQLAIAIENIRLVERLQSALRASDTSYGGGVMNSIRLGATNANATAYEYDSLDVRPISGLPPEWVQVAQAGKAEVISKSKNDKNGGRDTTLVVPVKLRDEIIGFIGIEREEASNNWTSDEITVVEAIANQAALNVENAMLLAETQRQATQEQLASEITARMRASLDLDMVLQTAVREMAEKLGIAQVDVHLSDGEEQK